MTSAKRWGRLVAVIQNGVNPVQIPGYVALHWSPGGQGRWSNTLAVHRRNENNTFAHGKLGWHCRALVAYMRSLDHFHTRNTSAGHQTAGGCSNRSVDCPYRIDSLCRLPVGIGRRHPPTGSPCSDSPCPDSPCPDSPCPPY